MEEKRPAGCVQLKREIGKVRADLRALDEPEARWAARCAESLLLGIAWIEYAGSGRPDAAEWTRTALSKKLDPTGWRKAALVQNMLGVSDSEVDEMFPNEAESGVLDRLRDTAGYIPYLEKASGRFGRRDWSQLSVERRAEICEFRSRVRRRFEDELERAYVPMLSRQFDFVLRIVAETARKNGLAFECTVPNPYETLMAPRSAA